MSKKAKKDEDVKKEVKTEIEVEVEVEVELSEVKKEFIKSLDKETVELLDEEIKYIPDEWFTLLKDEFTKEYFIKLKQSLSKETGIVYPPREDIYKWTNDCSIDDIKVIIIGQDPYHGPNQANGLAFSVREGIKLPPSLKNIFKGVNNDYPNTNINPISGDLTRWSKQGVLLLNTVLTVRKGQAHSHAKMGWEVFTIAVLQRVMAVQSVVVIIAWGKPAEKVVNSVTDGNKESKEGKEGKEGIMVLHGVHPSPLSAYRGFFTQGHFLKSNEWLKSNGKEEIKW